MVRISGIGFNMAAKFPLMDRQQPVDIAFHVDENEWNNTKSLQLRVLDIKRSE